MANSVDPDQMLCSGSTLFAHGLSVPIFRVIMVVSPDIPLEDTVHNHRLLKPA